MIMFFVEDNSFSPVSPLLFPLKKEVFPRVVHKFFHKGIIENIGAVRGIALMGSMELMGIMGR